MRIPTRGLRAVLLAGALAASAAVPTAAAAAVTPVPVRDVGRATSVETVGYSVWAPGHTATVHGRTFGRLDRESSASEWKHQAWCVDKGVGSTSVDWRLHRAGLAPSSIGTLTCDNEVTTEASRVLGPFVRLTVTVCKMPRYPERYCATREYAVPNP